MIFIFGLVLGAMFGFIGGVALMAVAAANKTAQHIYDYPTTDSREITDL